jgi:site-specific recombinase XerD
VKPSRHAPLEHPLVTLFERAIDSLSAAVSQQSARCYRGTARHFLIYLGEEYPEVCALDQLRRDPHILGWLTHLRSHTPPLAAITYINKILFLRILLQELAVTAKLPELGYLLRRQDLPRPPQQLPRALTAEQDHLIQQELLRRNDLAANVLLLLRHTGMRIGEAADLPYDCLHSPRPNQWAIHVPLGKLKTERMVPADSFVCELIHRIRFFRSFDPLPDNGLLLARPHSKETLVRHLRCDLHEVTAAVGISTRIVPHQLRHTYASEMLRSGVSFPVLMKLLGHKDPEMTMQYLDIALTDLDREFQLARSQPRHRMPQPKVHLASFRPGLDGVLDSFFAAQHAMEMFRRSLTDDYSRRCLDRLANRLTKIRSLLRKLNPPEI